MTIPAGGSNTSEGRFKPIGREEEVMSEHWYYMRAGQKHGPVPLDELRRRAGAGELLPTDLAWPEHGTPRSVMDVLAPSTRGASSTGKPDWLDDVRQAETDRAGPAQPASSASPDWLDDVKQHEASQAAPVVLPMPPAPAAVKPASPAPPPPPQLPLPVEAGDTDLQEEWPAWMWALFSLVVLILLAAIIVGMMIGRRNRARDPSPPSTQTGRPSLSARPARKPSRHGERAYFCACTCCIPFSNARSDWYSELYAASSPGAAGANTMPSLDMFATSSATFLPLAFQVLLK